jgi:GT2 family glycosyltransferase
MPDLHSRLAAPPRARPNRSVAGGPIDVSVCIVNWNCRDVLRACLDSLHEDVHGVRMEIIVVDNASTDGAPEMVAQEFPNVFLHRNPENFGFARANNQAAALTCGRYILFLNNDTEIPAGALRRLVHFADAHPEAGLVGPRLRDGEGRPQVSYRSRPTLAVLLHRTSLLRWTGLLKRAYRRYRRKEFDPETTRRVELLMGAAMLMPRHVFLACGGWDEDYTFGGEDLDLSYQVNRSYSIYYHPEVEITHYGRVSTRQHIGYVSTHMAVGFVRYLRKTGSSRAAVWFYKTIVLLDAPVQLVSKAMQYTWRRLRGRKDCAERSALALQGYWHFLRRGIGEFIRT